MGFALAQARLGPGRIHHCMRWMGLCERAFDAMAERAVTRKLSPEQRLGDTQTIQHWIAECRAEIDATRLLVLHAAWQIDNVGVKAAREAISLSVCRVHEDPGNRAAVTQFLDVALASLEERVLAHAVEHPVGVFLGGCRSFPMVGQWIESQVLQH